MTDEDIAKLITKRRRQILVHSVVYYAMNDNLIPDAQWAEWAQELAQLQEQYPEIAKTCPHADSFSGFDCSTGFNLPLNDPWAVNKARQLLRWKYRK